MTITLSTNAKTWAGLNKPSPSAETWHLTRYKGSIVLILRANGQSRETHWPANIPYDARMRRTMRGALHLLREKIKLEGRK